MKRRSTAIKHGILKKPKLSQFPEERKSPPRITPSPPRQFEPVTYLKPQAKNIDFKRVRGAPFKSTNDVRVFEEFNIIQQIGKGSYGTVVKATRKGSKQLWAVKQLQYRTSKSSKSEYQEISPDVYRELAVSSCRGFQLESKYIVPLNEVVFGKQECWFIYPCFRMDLRQMISKYKGNIPPEIIRIVFYQCVRATHDLHCAGFVHRDIKPSNYLIQYDEKTPGRILLADFGLSRNLRFPELNLHKDGEVVTLWYRPLDLLLGNKDYDYMADMWSLGCVLGELILGKPIFQGKPNNPRKTRAPKFEEDQVRTILQICGFPNTKFVGFSSFLPHYESLIRRDWRKIPNRLKETFPGLDKTCLALLRHLLCYHPHQRYCSKKTLCHSYFTGKDIRKFIWPENKPDFM